jgi:TATA-box binding protein (TBP) (component of TFIID and TFIIIB)
MIRIRINDLTILVFNNLKVRIMGKGNGHQKVFDEFLSHIPKVKVLSPLQLMSFTATYKFPFNINIQNLDPSKYNIDLETFPAAVLRHKGTENVNIFVSGKVVITGLKQIQRFHQLIEQITFQNDRD